VYSSKGIVKPPILAGCSDVLSVIKDVIMHLPLPQEGVGKQGFVRALAVSALQTVSETYTNLSNYESRLFGIQWYLLLPF
jgi:hypothetical protein